jgi:hypothetical protein
MLDYSYVNESSSEEEEEQEVHNEFYYSTKFDALLDELVLDSSNIEAWERLHLLGTH